MKKAAIFGAGISGLAAAGYLSKNGFDVTVYEKDDKPGGLAGTHVDGDGYIYDKGPHYFFTTLADKIGIRDKCFKVPFYESIYYKGKYYFFPFGLLKNLEFFFSVGLSFARNMLFGKGNPDNLEEFLFRHYGRKFSKSILQPLLEKWSGCPAKEMATSYEKRLLPGNIKYLLYSVLKIIRGYTEDYYEKGRYIVYPLGTMKTVIDRLIENGNFKLSLNSCVTDINIEGNRVIDIKINDSTAAADYYVSSMPVNLLEAISSSHILKDKLEGYRYRAIVILYLKYTGKKILKNLWNWYPEENLPFYRISEQIEHRENPAPEEGGRNVLMFELGCTPGEGIWAMKDEKILELGIRYASRLFDFDRTKLIGFRVDRINCAYPILLKKYDARQRDLGCDVGLENLFLTGRTGLFKYNMLEETYDSGIETAKYLESKCLKLQK